MLEDSLRKLLALLENPEPGLATWHEACERAAKRVEAEIAKARGEKSAPMTAAEFWEQIHG